MYRKRLRIAEDYADVMDRIDWIFNKLPSGRRQHSWEFNRMLEQYPEERKQLYVLWKEERRLERMSMGAIRRLRKCAADGDTIAVGLGFGLIKCGDPSCCCDETIEGVD